MAEPGWPRHAVRIGRFEFRRTVRAVREDTARFGLMALGAVVPSLLIAGFAVLFADVIRDAGPVALPTQVRGMVATVWLFGAFVVAQRVATARPRAEAEPLVLTTVSTRTAAVGLAIAEALRALAYVTPPALALTAAAVYLFGSPLSLLAVPAAWLLLVAGAVVAGSLAGYAVAWLVATVPFVSRHRTGLGGVAVLAFFGGYAALQSAGVGSVGYDLLAWLPIGWLADLAVVGTPVAGSGRRAAGAIGATALVCVGGGALIDRATAALWFTDPVTVDDGSSGAESASTAGRRDRDALSASVRPLAIPAVVGAPTRRVAEWTLLRTRRDPRRLTFLLVPVVGAGSALMNVGVQSGAPRPLLAPLCAVVLPWIAGAAFAVNPLGDEGTTLPATLLAVDGRRYVRGVSLPGLLLGLPTVVVATAATGVAAAYSPSQVLGLVLIGAYLTLVAVGTAPAVGMRLPRFSPIRVGRGRAVLPPRLAAVVLHAGLTLAPGALLALLVVAPELARAVVAGLVGYLPAIHLDLLGAAETLPGAVDAFRAVGDGLLATPVGRLRAGLGGGLLAGGAAAAVGCYRHAIGYFDAYVPA
ncbi:hypothetical protein [Salinilacihabitans rarus]|uniref:hypothetical protein n=1 Tax=Salinilacihabitans rarus TaxID=2961596 RepID=UPI0020C8E471|nr:hypothetical protein [Salinilacihabitans rarus]